MYLRHLHSDHGAGEEGSPTPPKITWAFENRNSVPILFIHCNNDPELPKGWGVIAVFPYERVRTLVNQSVSAVDDDLVIPVFLGNQF